MKLLLTLESLVIIESSNVTYKQNENNEYNILSADHYYIRL